MLEAVIEDIDDMSVNPTLIDLRAQYPMSPLAILHRSFYWLLAYSFLMTLIIAGLFQFPLGRDIDLFNDVFYSVALYVSLIATVIICLKLIYELLYHYFFHYKVEFGHIVVSSGVFLKQRSTLPIVRISDISLDRDILSYLLGLYDLYISIPSGSTSLEATKSPGAAFVIAGMSSRNAVQLQNHLNRLIARGPQIRRGGIQGFVSV